MKTVQTFQTDKIEPGLLAVFRLFLGLEWVLLGLSVPAVLRKTEVTPDYSSLIQWIEVSVLLIYLWWGGLARFLKDFYLPLALWVASVGPLLAQFVAGLVLLDRGVRGEAAQVDPVHLYTWLLIPLLLISSQYSSRILIGFIIGTALLPVILTLILSARGGPVINVESQNALVRVWFFSIVGFVVLRLSQAQRKQRKELAHQNARLTHYATTLEQLAISRERNRLAREMHDTLAHTLSAANVQLKALEVLMETDPVQARQTLKQTQDLTRDGLNEARRALHALRSSPLEELGFVPALERLAKQAAERANLDLKLEMPLPVTLRSLSQEVEQGFYRIAEEALNNVVRHARATRLYLGLLRDSGGLRLIISDNGQGFDVFATLPDHYGLTGLHERAALIGGRLEIKSQLRQGTLVEFYLEL